MLHFSGRFEWCTMELNWHARFSQMLKINLVYPLGKEPKGNACIGGAENVQGDWANHIHRDQSDLC